ncbi:hypothetical protein L1F30_16485 [Simiduia sp. 21SJ11W-1]|uniref:hypothetical protein n=1 Tax=Simiduia sp. 21SJ11W-1 TaxID=2909669 RepID=UPI00209FC4F2|nr:hypothetical protein [Simiduia sp. 21SJ11W-1]UTA47740.1 hypothetical protein L1F30_16485 [Simiduia sp. 21SJ11W-1]
MSFRRLNNRIKAHAAQTQLQRHAACQLINAMTTPSDKAVNTRALCLAMLGALATGFTVERLRHNSKVQTAAHALLTWAVFSMGHALPHTINVAASRWLMRR